MSQADVADGTESDTRDEYETRWARLSAFQRDLLGEIAACDGRPYGLQLIDRLEDLYDEEVLHGRTYPNLDDLADAGLIRKAEHDKRTNAYSLTAEGQAVLAAGADRLDDVRSTPRHTRIGAIRESDLYE